MHGPDHRDRAELVIEGGEGSDLRVSWRIGILQSRRDLTGVASCSAQVRRYSNIDK